MLRGWFSSLRRRKHHAVGSVWKAETGPLTFTRKNDTPYVCRDLASFTYFTLASISVISPQLLWSCTGNSHISTFSHHIGCLRKPCALNCGNNRPAYTLFPLNATHILGIFSSPTLFAWCTPLAKTLSGYKERERKTLFMVSFSSRRRFPFC